MDDNRLCKAAIMYLLGSVLVLPWPFFVLSLDVVFGLVSFGPVAAAMLFLAARTVARRLRYAPVEGELVEVGHKRWGYMTHRWRYELGGRAYEASDESAGMRIYLGFEAFPGKRKTVYVDPADPSRLLPPSWKDRLFMYLTMAVVLLFTILVLVNPQLFRSLPW